MATKRTLVQRKQKEKERKRNHVFGKTVARKAKSVKEINATDFDSTNLAKSIKGKVSVPIVVGGSKNKKGVRIALLKEDQPVKVSVAQNNASRNRTQPHVKYSFSAEEIMNLEQNKPELKRILDSEKYIFCEGYLCLNDKNLFYTKSGILRLKPKVKQMPRAFCLGQITGVSPARRKMLGLGESEFIIPIRK